MTTRSVPATPASSGGIESVARVGWLWLLPFAVAASSPLWLPQPQAQQTAWVRDLAEVLNRSWLLTGTALALTLHIVFRYWLYYLPGGRLLPGVPRDVVARLDFHGWRRARKASAVLDLALIERGSRATNQKQEKLLDSARKALRSGEIDAASRLTNELEQALRGEVMRARGLSWLLVGATGLVVVGVTSWVYGAARIQNLGMLPTLAPGDRFAVNHVAYLGGDELPKRGDVVLTNALVEGQAAQVAARVIGLPGDRIAMRGERPMINGWTVPGCDAGPYATVHDGILYEARLAVEWLEGRAYLTLQRVAPKLYENTYVVQPGEVFVVGDDRSNAVDSRHQRGGQGGGVDVSRISGRVDRVLVGTNGSGEPDFRKLIERVDTTRLNVQGLDRDAIAARVQDCLSSPPEDSTPPTQVLATDCGDGAIQPGEECDDGNRESEDGCDTNCISEAPSCERCTNKHPGCRERLAECTSRECQDVLTCVEKSRCAERFGLECYCGAADGEPNPLTCMQEEPRGSCVAEIQAAAGTRDAKDIAAGFIDPEVELGAAFRLVECRRTFCADECGMKNE